MAQKTKIILASGSPRRKMLLKSLGVEFESVVPNTDETYDGELSPEEIAKHVSKNKANEIVGKYQNSAVIAADTIVVIRDEILGKPEDKKDAYIMLRKLSGSWHEVITGICILYQNKQTLFSERTRVHFKELDDDFINWYIKTNEPMDKAGAYGIQGFGAVLVDRIDGDFYNVMGFPISKIMGELKKLDIYDIGRE